MKTQSYFSSFPFCTMYFIFPSFIYLGKVGITLNMNWNEPAIFNDISHIEAAEIKQQFQTGWFANPIFVNGKYPDIMRQKVKIIYFFLVQIFL